MVHFARKQPLDGMIEVFLRCGRFSASSLEVIVPQGFTVFCESLRATASKPFHLVNPLSSLDSDLNR